MKGWRKIIGFLAPEFAGGAVRPFYPDFR